VTLSGDMMRHQSEREEGDLKFPRARFDEACKPLSTV